MKKAVVYQISGLIAMGALLAGSAAWAAHAAIVAGPEAADDEWTEPLPLAEECEDPSTAGLLELRLEAAEIYAAAGAETGEEMSDFWLSEEARWMEILDRAVVLADGARHGLQPASALTHAERFAATATLFQAELIWTQAQAALEVVGERNPDDLERLTEHRAAAARAAWMIGEELQPETACAGITLSRADVPRETCEF